ncbi:MAG: SPASM domain-containing protein, partial [Eggerthellaceae bacterium]|nr:SPASM domain-containing protein [Eggerthellaceae bacterium]
ILTGGEPLMCEYVWDIIAYAKQKGLHPVMGTNVTMIDEGVAKKLADAGIPRISVSLDFPNAKDHDTFRGESGAFDAAMAGIREARRAGVEVQINSTITKLNADRVQEMHDLAVSLDTQAFHPFLLVPTGRGKELADVELSPEEYEEVLLWAYRCQKTSPLHFKPTDAPQYYRIIRQQCALEGRTVDVQTYGMEAMTRGCLGGISFVFISHIGDVQPCGYFDMKAGNVLEMPFSRIWTESKLFEDLRHFERLKGKCGICEFKQVCGGCRARALATTGDYLAEEPYCAYIPGSFKK